MHRTPPLHRVAALGLRVPLRPLAVAVLAASVAAAQGGSQAHPDEPTKPEVHRPNLLVLLADDLGVEQLASFGQGYDYPPTPRLDALAAEGMRFGNTWATPLCSPSRAALLTGRHGFRTGVGSLVKTGIHSGEPCFDHALPLTEITIPEMLDAGTGDAYASAAFGKWHLGNASVGGDLAPNMAGFDHFEGSVDNLILPYHYYSWSEIVDGVASTVSTYSTTEIVDSAIAWLETAPEPWFCYVAFHAPHDPFHAPPPELHTQDLSSVPPPWIEGRPYYKAMVEALDTEIGRLLDSLGPALERTDVVFLGDNGTPGPAQLPTLDRTKQKGSMYEGGVRVPLIVAGPDVSQPGGESDVLISIVDVYATLGELAGVDLQQVMPTGRSIDSVSFAPLLWDTPAADRRPFSYTELFGPNGLVGPFSPDLRGIRDEQYKLIVDLGAPREFYDLLADPLETVNLAHPSVTMTPEQLAAFTELYDTVLQILGS